MDVLEKLGPYFDQRNMSQRIIVQFISHSHLEQSGRLPEDQLYFDKMKFRILHYLIKEIKDSTNKLWPLVAEKESSIPRLVCYISGKILLVNDVCITSHVYSGGYKCRCGARNNPS